MNSTLWEVGMGPEEHPDGECLGIQTGETDHISSRMGSGPGKGPFCVLGLLCLFSRLPRVEHKPSCVETEASSCGAESRQCIRHGYCLH